MFVMRCNDYNKILKNIDEPIAFVLGRYLTTGLGVIRCLGRQGVPVVWLDSNPNQIGFLSKYCIGIVCPNPKNNEGKYVDFLMFVGENLNNKGILFPTEDVELLAVLKNKSKLEKYYQIPMADLEISEKLLNKYIFYKTLEKQGTPLPKTYFPRDVSELHSISKKITYPCIVKPSFSDRFMLDFKTKVFRAESSRQLVYLYNKAISKNHDVFVQEIVPGNARNMYGLNAYYDRNSTPNGVFMYRRIREWPHDFGNGCAIENIVVPELKEIIDPFIKKINYHGIIDAEFKKDPRDNKFKLIEINARCWMQIGLPSRCGVNIPYIAYMDAINDDVIKVISNNKHTKWFFISEDIQSSLKSMLKGDFSFREWIGSFRGEKEYAIFATDDPLPFFVVCVQSSFFPIQYIIQKFHIRAEKKI
jgi:predicted ATP-grasp superfamily ATP-dependent carboligase